MTRRGNFLDFDIGLAVLSVYDKDGFPGIQVDNYGEQKSGVGPLEQHSPAGFFSVPHDPDTDGKGNPTLGCPVLYAFDGSQGHVWASHDPRVIPILPPVKKGGSVVYGGPLKNPSFMFTDGETGSQTHYVPYAIVDGKATKAMTIEVNVDTLGQESIAIIHGSGMAITMLGSSTTIKNAAGDVYLEINDSTVTVNGQLAINGAASIGTPEKAVPLVLAPQLIALLNSLITIVAAINPTTPGTAAAGLLAQVASIAAQLAKGS